MLNFTSNFFFFFLQKVVFHKSFVQILVFLIFQTSRHLESGWKPYSIAAVMFDIFIESRLAWHCKYFLCFVVFLNIFINIYFCYFEFRSFGFYWLSNSIRWSRLVPPNKLVIVLFINLYFASLFLATIRIRYDRKLSPPSRCLFIISVFINFHSRFFQEFLLWPNECLLLGWW